MTTLTQSELDDLRERTHFNVTPLSRSEIKTLLDHIAQLTAENALLKSKAEIALSDLVRASARTADEYYDLLPVIEGKNARIAALEAQPSASDEMRQLARELRENANGDCGAVAQAIYWGKKAAALEAQAAQPSAQHGSEIEIDYTNYRGERAVRRIQPITIFVGSTEWHPETQPLLRAWDCEKNAERCFALCDIHAWDGHQSTAQVTPGLGKSLETALKLAHDRCNALEAELQELKKAALPALKRYFAVTGKDNLKHVSILCENEGVAKDGGIAFLVLNGAWYGTLKDGKVFVENNAEGIPAVVVWQGDELPPGISYNEQMKWIISNCDLPEGG